MVRPSVLLLGFIAWTIPSLLFAAPAREHGRSITRNFSHRDFAAPGQISGIVQRADSRIYFASQQAILEYDGSQWSNHSVPSVFSHFIATDAARQRLYVGAHDLVGFLEPDEVGRLAFHSLVEQLPDSIKPIGFSHGIVVRDDRVLFATHQNVLSWRNDKFELLPLPAGTARPQLLATSRQTFVHRPGVGLLRLEGSEFKLLVADEVVRDAPSLALWPRANGSLLLGAGKSGLWTWHDRALHRWPTAADEILLRTQISCGAVLSDGRIVIGTLGEGIVIVSPDGTAFDQFSLGQGVIDPAVRSVFVDRDHALWIGTDGGITRLDPDDGATIFDHHNGLRQPIINGIWRHRDRLYVSTLDGLLRLVPANPPSGSAARFEKVETIGRNPREMASHPSGLLIGTPEGIVRLREHDRTDVVLPLDQLALHPVWSKREPDTLFVGVRNGLAIARWQDDRLQLIARFDGLGEVRTLCETADGTVWLGTPSRGFHRVDRSPGQPWSEASVTSYNQANGRLVDHGWVEVFDSPQGPLFASALGLLRYDPTHDRFEPDPRFPIDGERYGSIRPIFATADGDLWAQATNDPAVTQRPLGRFRRQPDGSYRWQDAPRRLWDIIGLSGAQVLYWEPDDNEGVLWVKGIDSLLRLEVAKLATPEIDWQVLLRDFQHHGGSESVGDGTRLPTLPWSPDPIRISYTSPRFDYGAGIAYQTRLLGFSDQWSEPSGREEATYTNLAGGPFTFEVRAIDAENNVSRPARLTFSVAPPFHRSTPALLGYFAAGVIAVFGFIRWRLARAAREKTRLEQLVAQRTAELAAANKAKSVFLANMSHELRTPLNGVIGYAQVLQKSPDIVSRDRERLRIVQTSGEHLLRMINEVLDFSKIEAGKLELRPAPFHLPQLLNDIATAFEPRATQKELAFALDADADLPTMVVGDAQKLRQVLDNLLGNAIKFTPAGRVALRVARAPSSGLSALSSQLCFTIDDTGVGISEKDQASLFQPFQQPVDGRPPEPGTGLGLAIAKRLVELMGGHLALESAPGVGSTFSFTVPLDELSSDTPAAEPAQRPPIGYRGDRRRLLVVDDVAINRSVLVELLAPLGFELREAAGGPAALALVAEFRPDLVFLDLRMPGMSGLEVATRLRPSPATRKPILIAMSASVLSFNRDKALEAGCDDFLPKPFRETDLIATLTLHLGLVWRYGDSAHPFPPQAPSLASTEELVSLLAIAKRGEIRHLREQLTALRRRHPHDHRLTDLEALARGYQMERIRAQLALSLNAAPRS